MRNKLTTLQAPRADAEKSSMTLCVGFMHGRARHRATGCIPFEPYLMTAWSTTYDDTADNLRFSYDANSGIYYDVSLADNNYP